MNFNLLITLLSDCAEMICFMILPHDLPHDLIRGRLILVEEQFDNSMDRAFGQTDSQKGSLKRTCSYHKL